MSVVDNTDKMRSRFIDCLSDEAFDKSVRAHCLKLYAAEDVTTFIQTCDYAQLDALLEAFNFWYKYDDPTDLDSDPCAKVKMFVVPLMLVDGCVRIAYSKYQYPIRIHEFVGDYSQEVHLCSYNEGYVRMDWHSGMMNHCVADANPKRATLRHYRLRDSDYQSLVTALVSIYGKWPVNYSSLPEESEALKTSEREMVDDFNFKDWFGRYQSLPSVDNLKGDT